MATHSGVLAWTIPWTEKSGELVYGVAKESDTTEQLSSHTKIVTIQGATFVQRNKSKMETQNAVGSLFPKALSLTSIYS